MSATPLADAARAESLKPDHPASQSFADLQRLIRSGHRVWSFRREDLCALACAEGWHGLLLRDGYDPMRAESLHYDDGSIVIGCKVRLSDDSDGGPDA